MPATLPSATRRRLERLARAMAESAYAPYSKFRVGAAVLAGSGRIYGGCNVENASYGLCNCAERTAIFTAAAAGEREIKAVLVYTPTPEATAPCGACRQVISEFGPEAIVVSVCDSPAHLDTCLSALLPESFGAGNLKAAARQPKRRVR